MNYNHNLGPSFWDKISRQCTQGGVRGRFQHLIQYLESVINEYDAFLCIRVAWGIQISECGWGAR